MKRILSVLLLALYCGLGHAATLDQDVDTYVAIFKGPDSGHNQASESLAWMGLSDPRLFDLLEAKLLNEYQAARDQRDEKNRVARYIRALGFSGNRKYVPTLERFIKDNTYDRYAREALQDMNEYARWNPVISNRASFNPAYSDDANRVLNMLRDDDLVLNRLGGKRVYFATKDDVVLDQLENRVRATYAMRFRSDDEADGAAWMVKALGSSGKEKYRGLLQEAARNGGDKAVVRHAKGTLEKNYR